MVAKYLNQKGSSLKFRALLLKVFNNGKQLLIINLVVIFGGGQKIGVESNRKKSTVRSVLRQDASRGVVRRVSFYNVGQFRVEVSKDRYRVKGLFKSLKSVFTGFIEYERDVFTGQSYERGDNLREIRYKSSVEISKPNKGTDIFYV